MNVSELTDSKVSLRCTAHEPKNRDTVTASAPQVGSSKREGGNAIDRKSIS